MRRTRNMKNSNATPPSGNPVKGGVSPVGANIQASLGNAQASGIWIVAVGS